MKIKTWALTGLVLAIGLGLWGLRQRGAPAAPPSSSANQTDHIEVATTDLVTLQAQSIAEGVAVSGTLRAVQSAWVKARVAGELQGFSLREGDAVRAGQVIGHIDPTEFEVAHWLFFRHSRISASHSMLPACGLSLAAIMS